MAMRSYKTQKAAEYCVFKKEGNAEKMKVSRLAVSEGQIRQAI